MSIAQHHGTTQLSKTALAFAISTALAPMAQAQDDAEDSAMIEEVIVTATKRAADIQDIPIAVTAISWEMLT